MVLKYLLILKQNKTFRIYTPFKQKNFFQTHKHKEKQFWKHFEQVPKSPWITTDRKGANNFPFYNLPPVLKISKKEFFCAFVLSMLEKIKDGSDSCLPRHTRSSFKQ